MMGYLIYLNVYGCCQYRGSHATMKAHHVVIKEIYEENDISKL